MRILTIDTSAIASAAVLEFDPLDPVRTTELVANFATDDTRSHAEVLAPGVKSLFKDAVAEGPALDAIVVGTGPGPFTGLRSGIAMARTLRKEVYWAKYNAGAHLLDGPHVGPANQISGVLVFGAGAGLYRDVLENNGCSVHLEFAQAQPTALELGRAAARRITAAGSLQTAGLLASTPLYLRESDAKVPGPRKRAL